MVIHGQWDVMGAHDSGCFLIVKGRYFYRFKFQRVSGLPFKMVWSDIVNLSRRKSSKKHQILTKMQQNLKSMHHRQNIDTLVKSMDWKILFWLVELTWRKVRNHEVEQKVVLEIHQLCGKNVTKWRKIVSAEQEETTRHL